MLQESELKSLEWSVFFIFGVHVDRELSVGSIVNLADSCIVNYRVVVVAFVFFSDGVHLAYEVLSLWCCLAVFNDMAFFPAVEAQIIIHASLSFFLGKSAALLRWGSPTCRLGSVNPSIDLSILSLYFLDSGSTALPCRSGIDAPIAIEVACFLYHGVQCSWCQSDVQQFLLKTRMKALPKGVLFGSVVDTRTSGVLTPELVPFSKV